MIGERGPGPEASSHERVWTLHAGGHLMVESSVSKARLCEIFKTLDVMLRTQLEIGKYSQTI
jgi:hypothetical protein